jgi:SAM-dependent methyltransferase
MDLDLFGTALTDYQKGMYTEDLFTHSSIAGEDVLPLPYLFRSYKQMPAIEQKALQEAKGTILDIGAGAGSHALYLQEQQKDVTAIDISKGAVMTCKNRGLQKAAQRDIWGLTNQKFDTLLVLMNGAGICGSLKRLGPFLDHLKKLLTAKGQILIDSSDLIYLFENEKGEFWIDSEAAYYGEVSFQMAYKNQKTAPFDWLYVDFNTLKRCANFNGLQCELLLEGDNYDYLAKLTHL